MDRVFNKDRNALVVREDFDTSGGGNNPWGALPEKVNEQIPDAAWLLMQDAARLAVSHLHTIMQPHMFRRLTPREQAKFIEVAMTRAYGSPDGSVRKHLHLKVDEKNAARVNEMFNLSKKARDLPEFNSKKAAPADAAERVVPLRRSAYRNSDD